MRGVNTIIFRSDKRSICQNHAAGVEHEICHGIPDHSFRELNKPRRKRLRFFTHFKASCQLAKSKTLECPYWLNIDSHNPHRPAANQGNYPRQHLCDIRTPFIPFPHRPNSTASNSTFSRQTFPSPPVRTKPAVPTA